MTLPVLGSIRLTFPKAQFMTFWYRSMRSIRLMVLKALWNCGSTRNFFLSMQVQANIIPKPSNSARIDCSMNYSCSWRTLGMPGRFLREWLATSKRSLSAFSLILHTSNYKVSEYISRSSLGQSSPETLCQRCRDSLFWFLILWSSIWFSFV